VGEGGWLGGQSEGRGGPLEGADPENHIKPTTYSTEYTMHNSQYATHLQQKLHKMTDASVFLYCTWNNDFDGGKSITFLGPNGTHFARCHIKVLKSNDFQVQPFQWSSKWF
jgi:hypothetical protein